MFKPINLIVSGHKISWLWFNLATVTFTLSELNCLYLIIVPNYTSVDMLPTFFDSLKLLSHSGHFHGYLIYYLRYWEVHKRFLASWEGWICPGRDYILMYCYWISRKVLYELSSFGTCFQCLMLGIWYISHLYGVSCLYLQGHLPHFALIHDN